MTDIELTDIELIDAIVEGLQILRKRAEIRSEATIAAKEALPVDDGDE